VRYSIARARISGYRKQAPALILAKKHGKKVLPAPEGYGFEQGSGFYFSHMLNCLYDCRYCFLQGMYRSAHYILFTNYEDFMHDILGQSGSSSRKRILQWL
jgi:spore photoproduct lyase